MPDCTGLDELVDRVAALADRPRVLLGLAGPPAAGKSTLAGWLVARLRARGLPAVDVPMDGFHLADAALDVLGRRGRKGAPDTFDAGGYLALLRRLRTDTAHVIYAPEFERDLEQPLAGSIAVPPETRVVVSEGNYLLLDDPAWRDVAAAFDEVWYVDLDDAERRRRLLGRHVRFGKTPEEAAAWLATVDDPNARLVAATADRAHRRVHLADMDLTPTGDADHPA